MDLVSRPHSIILRSRPVPRLLWPISATSCAKGVEVTDIVDHGWAQSIYFKDPNGLSLEYCCQVRNLTEDDARMQERFTVPRAALDFSCSDLEKVFVTQSVHGKRNA